MYMYTVQSDIVIVFVCCSGDDFIWGSTNGGCKCERKSHDHHMILGHVTIM